MTACLLDLVKTYLYIWFLFDTKKSSTQHSGAPILGTRSHARVWRGTECSSLTRARGADMKPRLLHTFQALQSYVSQPHVFLKAASTLTPVWRLFTVAPKNEIKLYGGSGGCSLHMRQESFPVRVSPSKMTNETLSQRSERLSGSRVASWQSSKVAKKFALSGGGACGSSCMPNTAIQRI